MVSKTAGMRVGAGAAAALLAAQALADVKDGVDAWAAGDFTRAVAEWQGPAAEGDRDALFNLAQAYRLGRGVALDNARARQLYEQAARLGHVKAADNYGLMLFQEGEQEAAMPLIRAAADRGDPRAQYVLGLSHFNGDYAARDWVRAYALMTLAHGAGVPHAADALAQMEIYMPQGQRVRGQALARELEEGVQAQRSAHLAAEPAPSATVLPAVVESPAKAPAAPAKPIPSVAAAPRPRGTWRVQLGAFGAAGNAERLWSQLRSHGALAGTTKTLLPSGKLTRLLAVGFTSEAEASRACAALKREGKACVVAGQG